MPRICRALGLLCVAVFLSLATAGVATAAPTVPSQTCPTSTSCPTTHPGKSHTPSTHGHGPTRYCVSGYKPGTIVTITNPKTGTTIRVTVGANGDACTTVPTTQGCQSIRATGTGADGTPTSSSARVCDIPEPTTVGSSLPFTGSSLIVPGTAAGLALLVGGSLLVLFTRRRRAATLA